MPEFPFCSHSHSFSAWIIKKKQHIFAFFLSLSSFFQMPKQSLILYSKIKEKKQTQKRQQEIAQLVVPVWSIFKTFSTRISLPISMIFTSPFYSLSLSTWLSFFGISFVAHISKALLQLCGLIYQKSIGVHRLLLHVVLIC